MTRSLSSYSPEDVFVVPSLTQKGSRSFVLSVMHVFLGAQGLLLGITEALVLKPFRIPPAGTVTGLSLLWGGGRVPCCPRRRATLDGGCATPRPACQGVAPRSSALPRLLGALISETISAFLAQGDIAKPQTDLWQPRCWFAVTLCPVPRGP